MKDLEVFVIKYIFKRILFMIPMLLGIIVIIFSLMYIAPGDPAITILGESATQEAIDEIHEEYGLNDPYFVQLGRQLWNLLHGDMGISYMSKRAVTEEIAARFPTTLRLVLISAFFGLIIGVVAGVVSAVRQYSIWDRILTMFSLLGISVPSFWLSMLLVLLFAMELKWLPISGLNSPLSYVLPVFTLGLQSSAYIMRMTRSSMLDVIRQDYIATARAKGQREIVIILKHGLKNSFMTILTAFGVQVANLMAGTVMVETMFAIPGLSKYLINCVNNNDYPTVQGIVLVIAFTTIFINLLVDIIYGFIDPRIKLSMSAKKKQKKSA